MKKRVFMQIMMKNRAGRLLRFLYVIFIQNTHTHQNIQETNALAGVYSSAQPWRPASDCCCCTAIPNGLCPFWT